MWWTIIVDVYLTIPTKLLLILLVNLNNYNVWTTHAFIILRGQNSMNLDVPRCVLIPWHEPFRLTDINVLFLKVGCLNQDCHRHCVEGFMVPANHGPLTRYTKLWVAHEPGMPRTFSPPPWISDPDIHHGMCVAHVPWCMSGSLMNGFFGSRWRGKRSRHTWRMRNPQFCVSGKRPMGRFSKLITKSCGTHNVVHKTTHTWLFECYKNNYVAFKLVQGHQPIL